MRRLEGPELVAYDHIDGALAVRVRIVRVPVLPPGAAGMTIGRFVLLTSDHDRRGGRELIAHELVHVRQFAAAGTVRFLVRYGLDYLAGLRTHRRHRAAYLAIPAEVEARAEAGRWREARGQSRTLAGGPAEEVNGRARTLGSVRLLDPPTRHHSPRVIQVVALMGVAASSFTITVLSAALPDIAEDLDSSTSTVTWVIAGPLLAFAVFTPMAGKLGDLYGHRRVYLIGFTGAAVMSFVTAASPSAGFLIGARILAQAFASSTGPSALALMMQSFPEEERTSVAGTWSAVLAASPAVGVIVGGPLIDATSWRALFLIQGVGMVVAVIAAVRVLPSTERRHDLSFDLLGGVFLALAIAAVLIPLNRAPSLGWDHPVVAGGLVAAPFLLALFVWWERRTPHPLIELPVLRERNVALPLVSQLFLNGPYMAGLVITSLMLGAVFDYSTTAISLLILPRPIAFAIGAAGAGRLVEWAGGRAIVVLGCGGIAGGLALIGAGTVTESVVLVLAGVAIAGAGSGIARPPIIAALTETVGNRDLGVGTGMLNMTGQIGAAAGISLLSALVDDTSSPERFMAVFLIASVIALSSIATAGAIRFGPALAPVHQSYPGSGQPDATVPSRRPGEAGAAAGQ